MKSLLRKLILWATRNDMSDRPIQATADVLRSDMAPTCRIAVLKALNGKILEVSTYKHNPHGPDWTSEMFIVPEDQTLTQALTTLLVMKGVQ